MTFREFITIPQEQQFDLVWEKGFLIGERHDTNNSYALYVLNAFYVELKYRKKKIEDLRCFIDTKCLLPYDKKRVSKIIGTRILHN